MEILRMAQHLEDGSPNPDWLIARRGKFTGSDFYQYMSLAKTGKLTDTAKKALYKKVLEHRGYTFDSFVSPAAQRGLELESHARDAYSLVYDKPVEEVGFVDYGKFHAGCSPDGIIRGTTVVDDIEWDSVEGELKLTDPKHFITISEIIEIKCPLVETFVAYLDGYMNPEYEIQCQYNMFITGADVCHFIVYHPDFNLIVRDIPKDVATQQKIQATLEQLNAIYEDINNKISTNDLEGGVPWKTTEN